MAEAAPPRTHRSRFAWKREPVPHANAHSDLTVRTAGHRVLIEIADECGGLAAGVEDAMFRPFEQVGASQPGMGLGLGISRRSVEAQGGELRVRNVPGTGCIFTVDLPAAARDATS